MCCRPPRGYLNPKVHGARPAQTHEASRAGYVEHRAAPVDLVVQALDISRRTGHQIVEATELPRSVEELKVTLHGCRHGGLATQLGCKGSKAVGGNGKVVVVGA